ncbi:MAG TPA: hypothetical protein VGQ11_04650 [Candidatus Acidoferrales bacterium]|nr:hypothetical protein [Candidatus Acidoferrales bacterium]
MKLEKIITLANAAVRLRFAAMERSLRAVGCNLPLAVIPYDAQKFDLPANASWWEMADVLAWLAAEKTHAAMRKYQCLLAANYQFVDADVIFLRNPEEVLAPHAGFITSCCHWRDAGHTTTKESEKILSAKSTTWRKTTFNSGQFACDRALHDFEGLKRAAAKYAATCLRLPYHEQPGVNLLVNESGVEITNLTLPPHCMESTWAGDYPGAYENFWRDAARKPYLIHWAGTAMDVPRPINKLFYDFLTAAEKAEWDAQVAAKKKQKSLPIVPLRGVARRVKRAFEGLAGR